VREMQELCPQALFLNFSNPENRIILALGKYSPIRALGLCHGIFMGQGDAARILGMPYERVEVWGAGLNHSQCLMQIRDRTTGEDLYPQLRTKEKDFDPAFMPLTRRLFRAFGYWMTCSDDHLGEYLAYGWEAGEHGYDFAGDERGRGEFSNALDRVLAGAPVPPDWLTPSGERGAAAIGGILHNKKRVLESGIVPNRGTIPNLPYDAAVEVPVMADTAGIHPISLGPLPDAIAKLLHTQVNVQELAVEAAMRGSKELALQALLIDPVVNSASAAVKLLDELWDLNRPYIRSCL
jgi:alpha-galactosidase